MALTATEQKLLDEANASMPDWFRGEREQEDAGQAAKQAGNIITRADEWLATQAFIETATGPTADEPDWLEQHARDRGTHRQEDEADETLRLRLQSVGKIVHDPPQPEDGMPVAIVRTAILVAANDILAANGGAEDPDDRVQMVEMPRDQIFLVNVVQDAGTGGEFTGPDGDDVMEFLPTAPARFAYPPYTEASGRVKSHNLVISGAASSANNGTFATIGMNGDAVRYVNATGVADDDAGADWVTERINIHGLAMEGHGLCYLSRGDRIGRSRGGTIVLIIPYIAVADVRTTVRKSITEMLRQKKGAGVIQVVEARATAP